MKRSVLTSCFILSFFGVISAGPAKIALTNNWQFHKKGESNWNPAIVPGTVHTDLLNNKLIPDPYFRDNEKDLQWIEQEDWEYKCSFKVQGSFINKEHVMLVFEGLDTYATIYVNDAQVLMTNNMFRTWEIDLKKILKSGDNNLKILFEPAVRKGKEAAKALSYTLPGGERVFARKAQYQYGWDWGPRFVTCGIWRPVYLEAWNDTKINDIQVVQKSLTNDKAFMTVVFELNSTAGGVYDLSVNDPASGKAYKTEKVTIPAGISKSSLDFVISNPILWWTNGLGEAHLYKLSFTLAKNNVALDSRKTRVGLRSLEIVRDKDTSGTSFYVKLNGLAVFMKGANYIPPDNFMPRVGKDKYQQIVNNAASVHMNMLRVWGGGNYEEDQFYDFCDEKGILVWQDFMFACALYPGDTAFLGNVRQEILQNVKRLRNHPCIALWCGNNENEEGWVNWGWQKQFKSSDTSKIYTDYKKLFHEMIPSVLRENDPGRFYWPSSPKAAGNGKDNLKDGDCHYWGVWANKEAFSTYDKKVGRFMSEFGFQAYPPMKTIEKFTLPEDRQVNSLAMKAHQKHPRGQETIQEYFEQEYKPPRNLESYSLLSQILQAEGIARAIEAYRRSAPYCMGSLYWQLNDCWPAVSWSSTDYYGDWKALHYKLKQAYAPVLITIEERESDNKALVHLINDSRETVAGTLYVGLTEVVGNGMWSNYMPFSLSPGYNGVFTEVSMDMMNSMHNKHVAMLYVSLKNGNNVIAAKNYYFGHMRNLSFLRPYVISETKASGDGFDVEIQTDKFAKDMYLKLKEGEGFFDDNFFDISAGEIKKVHCSTKLDKDSFDKALEIRTIVDCY